MHPFAGGRRAQTLAFTRAHSDTTAKPGPLCFRQDERVNPFAEMDSGREIHSDDSSMRQWEAGSGKQMNSGAFEGWDVP